MKTRFTFLTGIALGLFAALPFSAAAQSGQVRIVFFFLPGCAPCEMLKALDIPEWKMRYGAQLRIFEVDISNSPGRGLFESAIDFYGLSRAGVPMMILEDRILLGSSEIRTQLDILIEHYLMTLDGNEWPPIPGLAELLADQEPVLHTLTVQSTPPTAVDIYSNTGHGGRTEYAISAIVPDTRVELTAPEYLWTDGSWHRFANWAGDAPGTERTIAFDLDADKTAIAQYAQTGIALSSPAGGEVWERGKVVAIDWSIVGDPGPSVRLEYSTDGGASWEIIAGAVPAADGRYSWIPAAAFESCRIRISSASHPAIQDISGTFAITDGEDTAVQSSSWGNIKASLGE